MNCKSDLTHCRPLKSLLIESKDSNYFNVYSNYFKINYFKTKTLIITELK